MELERTWLNKIAMAEIAFEPVVNVYSGLLYGVRAHISNAEDAPIAFEQTFLDQAFNDGVIHLVLPQIHRKAIQKFKCLIGYQGLKLFLKLDLRAMINRQIDPLFTTGANLPDGLSGSSIVLEFNEAGTPSILDQMTHVLERFPSRICKLAFDGFGRGCGGLRLCFDYRPNIINIDPFFAAAIEINRRKRAMVSSIISLARDTGAAVIASGVDNEKALRSFGELGCELAMGTFVGSASINIDTIRPAYAHVAEVASRMRRLHDLSTVIMDNIEQVPCVNQKSNLPDVLAVFGTDGKLTFLPVVDDTNEPVGIVRESDIKSYVYSAYGREILKNKSVKRSLDKWIQDCPVVDINARIDEFVRAYASNAGNEGLIVVEDRRFVGFLSSRALLSIISEQNVAAARDSNPLTGLPGNHLINDAATRALADTQTHAAFAFFDFDNFKPFNDTYGFRQGDRALILFADLLRSSFSSQDAFVGHVGGDDFFALFRNQSASGVEPLISNLLAKFKDNIESFYDADTRRNGYLSAIDREGQMRRYPLLRASCALVDAPIGRSLIGLDALSERLADEKKSAKASQTGLAMASWPNESPDQDANKLPNTRGAALAMPSDWVANC